MALPAILIFDIGKTNKKLLLFDESYTVIYEETIQLAEVKDEDGFFCEDVDALCIWLQQSFEKILQDDRYDVKAINFSAYGASFVNIDEHGKIRTSLYNYLKPYPEKIIAQFYNTYGNKNKLAVETASPALASLNSGLQLYRLKYEQPSVFQKLKYALHLPQFASYLFTKKPATDITSIGCHTMLWNFDANKYHHWAINEALDKIFPPLTSHEIFFTINTNNKKIISGIGLHDSSAALIPYLKTFKQPFILISTGTWCISLNPFNDEALTIEELEQDCLRYLTFDGKPVKASRLFSGDEHEKCIKELAKTFNKEKDFYKSLSYDESIIKKILSFSNYGKATYEEAYHAFMLNILDKQIQSTDLVIGEAGVESIFVDGGFSKNPIYMQLLANAYPTVKVYAAEVAQASALGAAIVLHEHWNKNLLPENLLRVKEFKPITGN